jgi:hypothetical protein
MAIYHFRLRSIDPSDSKALQILTERLKRNPEDEGLRDNVRSLQLLTRRAFFTAQWQINTGAYILVGNVVVLCICLWLMRLISKKSPHPNGGAAVEAYWRSKAASRLALAIGAAFVLAAAGVLIVRPWGFLREENLSEAALQQNRAAARDRLSAIAAQQWPAFRGPGGNGIAASSVAPVRWDGSGGINILWKTKIEKPGNNSPVVWGERLFVAGADERSEVVYCLDRRSGQVLWTFEVGEIENGPEAPPVTSLETGFAAPTMAASGSHVFAIFATGNIVGLDFSGNALWSRNLGVPENHYGHASSLMVSENILLVQYDQEEEAYLFGLDAGTGVELWRTRRDVLTSWASPILVDTGSRIELITSANPYVAAYDPRTGRELWKVDIMMGEVGPSPAFSNGYVFAANQVASLAAIDVKTGEVVWEFFDDLPTASSPLATDKNVYIAADYGVVTCLDLRTGDTHWIHEFDQGFYSSPILVGDLVYLINRDGVMHIFRDSVTFELVSEPVLGEECSTTPAVVDERIYIRGLEHLYAIGGPVEGRSPEG